MLLVIAQAMPLEFVLAKHQRWPLVVRASGAHRQLAGPSRSTSRSTSRSPALSTVRWLPAIHCDGT